MAKLYELTGNYNNIIDLVDNGEVQADVITQALDTITEDINTKVENIAKVIKSIDVDVKGLKEEEKRLADRRKALENRTKGLKQYIEDCLKATGIKKVKGKVFTLQIQKNVPSVNITNLEAIPKEYIQVETIEKVDKKEILQKLKEGQKITGAELQQTESLRIR